MLRGLERAVRGRPDDQGRDSGSRDSSQGSQSDSLDLGDLGDFLAGLGDGDVPDLADVEAFLGDRMGELGTLLSDLLDSWQSGDSLDLGMLDLEQLRQWAEQNLANRHCKFRCGFALVKNLIDSNYNITSAEARER